MLLSAISAKVFLFCILGGVVPTFFWLWFWLREDQSNPEPKPLIISSFILGMIAVPLAIPFEKFVTSITSLPIAVFVGWAIVEEFLKFSASYLGGGHTQAEDEPIDVMIYVITAALGFAAAENALFLISPFLEGQIFVGVITSNIRFIGTTLLHILSSSLIGAALAFSFYQKREVKIEYFLTGFMGAVTLHALFNFFIIKAGPRGIFLVFALVWIAIIGLLIMFEKIKRIKKV